MKARSIDHITIWKNKGGIMTDIQAVDKRKRIVFAYVNPEGIGNNPEALRLAKMLYRKNSRFSERSITPIVNNYHSH